MDSEIEIVYFKSHRILWSDVMSIWLFESNSFEISYNAHTIHIEQPSHTWIHDSKGLFLKLLKKTIVIYFESLVFGLSLKLIVELTNWCLKKERLIFSYYLTILTVFT